MEIKEENGVFSVTQKAIYEIVKKEDEALINTLKDYAKENSAELRLLDEEKVKAIIKKGIMVYHAEEHKSYSHSYISKRKIEEKIEELRKKGNYRDIYNPTGRVYFMKEGTDYQIEILKELLDE